MKKDMESGVADVVDFKRELPSQDKKVMKTVVAFANYRAGRIIFEVDNSPLGSVSCPEPELPMLLAEE